MTDLQQYYDTTWEAIKDSIKKSDMYADYVFNILFGDTRLASIQNDSLTIVCPTMMGQLMMVQEQKKLEQKITESLHNGKTYTLNPVYKNKYEEEQKQAEEALRGEKPFDHHVNEEFTFDNFVVGDCNRQAQSASVACAYNPGNFYNPLFIYGDSGLGKTHLLFAIGNYILKNHPHLRVLYLPTYDFISAYIASLKKGAEETTQELTEKLQSVDVLLIDDIQFLSGKTRSNDYFFQIYNSLVNNRKQVVLTSDKSPFELNNFDIEDRLVSRFSSGLTVTINSPEYNTRLEILKMKARENNVTVDEETLSYIAANCTGDVRKLEGMLNQILFYQIQYCDMNSKAAIHEILKNSSLENSVDPDKIIRAVGDYYHITKGQMLSKNRSKNILFARHMAMYLCRKKLDLPFSQIAKSFNNCDHTTVMNACSKIDRLVGGDPMYARAVQEISQKIR